MPALAISTLGASIDTFGACFIGWWYVSLSALVQVFNGHMTKKASGTLVHLDYLYW